MSYPAFLLLGLFITSAIAAVLAGPLSALCVIAFWVAHYFFLDWRHKNASLKSMSDSELSDVLDWWTGRGPFGRSKPELLRVRERNNPDELATALKRIIEILDEKIKREQTYSLDTSQNEQTRQQHANELQRLINTPTKENLK